MPPKGKKVAAAAEPVEIPQSVKLGFGAFVALLLGVLWYSTTETALYAATRSLVTNFNLNNVAVELERGADGKAVLVAKQNLFQNQPVLGLNAESVLDVRTIQESPVGKLFHSDNGTTVNDIGRDNQLPQGAFTLMLFSTFFALERRQGSASKYHPFFTSLPSQLATAVYWSPDVLPCLDSSAAGEYRAQLRTLNATKETLAILCAQAPEAVEVGCHGNPPTEEELAWGMSVYLQHNFQDQAFVPLLSFATFNNEQGGVTPQFDRESGNLVFHAGANMKKGDPVTLNFHRGPQVFLAAFSEFQKDARGVELGLQVPDDEAGRAICPITELQFGVNGRPRDGLVNCMSYMVAPAEIKAKLAKNMRKHRTAELVAYTYGNLTYAANMLRDDKVDDAACAKVETSPVVEAARQFTAWRRKVLDANRVYLEQQAALKYQAAGIPLPAPEPAAPIGGGDEEPAE